MSITSKFIEKYKKEFHFYKEVAYTGQDIIENEIFKRGIKAIISSRAKKIDRLKEKLEKRNITKKYKSIISIEKDIVDLAGIRVSLYFPSERKIVGKIIEELFDVVETKDFPENPHKPKHDKRFSGYWATHYRVKFKKNKEVEISLTETIFEIQVASVLMHAWSEVEHDLVYKPFSGNLTQNELSILDEINGLVLTGEIALERLQKAITERTKSEGKITNKYDFTNLIFDNYNENFKEIEFGNTQYLTTYLKAIEKIDTSQVFKAIDRIDLNINDTFSDQLFNNIITINKGNGINKYYNHIIKNKDTVSGFELFTKTWIVLEKTIRQLNKEFGIDNQFSYIKIIDHLPSKSNLDKNDIERIKHLKNIRNKILHGHDSFSDNQLKEYHKELYTIVKKLIRNIKNQNVAKRLRKDLN